MKFMDPTTLNQADRCSGTFIVVRSIHGTGFRSTRSISVGFIFRSGIRVPFDLLLLSYY